MKRRRPDPAARGAILAIGAVRIAIGAGTFAAPLPTLRALGFAEPGPQALALARVAGSRDIALGALTLAARDDRRLLRGVGLAAAAVDVGDTITFAIASRRSGLGLAGTLGACAGAGAALAGGWARRRL